MPPSPLQRRVLQTLAANRSPDSHVAGGIVINYEGARHSYDIDIFNDPKVDVEQVADADAALLTNAGFNVRWVRRRGTMVTAEIRCDDEATSLDWVQDSAFRFFPVSPHPELGYALHPFDLATNKALAAASRREPRDAVDLVYLDAHLVPLGAIVWAAVAKDEGYSPDLLLEWIVRFAHYRQDELDRVKSDDRLNAAELSHQLRGAVDRARAFVGAMPPDKVGLAFLSGGDTVVQPDPLRLADYVERRASVGGVWPSPTGE